MKQRYRLLKYIASMSKVSSTFLFMLFLQPKLSFGLHTYQIYQINNSKLFVFPGKTTLSKPSTLVSGIHIWHQSISRSVYLVYFVYFLQYFDTCFVSVKWSQHHCSSLITFLCNVSFNIHTILVNIHFSPSKVTVPLRGC